MEKIFEAWWKECGQFDCASGQDCHKTVIHDAFMAGAMFGEILSNRNKLKKPNRSSVQPSDFGKMPVI